MATLPSINRARILMDLLKDDEVTTLVNYADDQVDYLDGSTAIKWAEKAWDAIPPPDDPPKTNDNMAIWFIIVLRRYLASLNRTNLAPPAAEAARLQAITSADAETETDLGTDEDVS